MGQNKFKIDISCLFPRQECDFQKIFCFKIDEISYSKGWEGSLNLRTGPQTSQTLGLSSKSEPRTYRTPKNGQTSNQVRSKSSSKVGFSNISNKCNTVSPCASVIEAQLRLSHGRILIYYMYSLSKNFFKIFYRLCQQYIPNFYKLFQNVETNE